MKFFKEKKNDELFILEELDDIKEELIRLRGIFDSTSDELVLEGMIFQIKAMEIKYRHLSRQLRNNPTNKTIKNIS